MSNIDDKLNEVLGIVEDTPKEIVPKETKELTVPERAYISRNTNYHAETIPQELFRILPRNEKRKLLDSINERAKLDRLTLQPIDQQIKDSFESLADKIESQED